MDESDSPAILRAETLRAQRLEIGGDKSNTRIFLDAADGNARIVAWDVRGERRVVVTVRPKGGAELQLYGGDLSAQIGMAISNKECGYLIEGH